MYSWSFEAALLVAVEHALGREGHPAHAAVGTVLVVRIDVVQKIVPRREGQGTSLEGAAEESDINVSGRVSHPVLLRGDLGLEGGGRRGLGDAELLPPAIAALG